MRKTGKDTITPKALGAHLLIMEKMLAEARRQLKLTTILDKDLELTGELKTATLDMLPSFGRFIKLLNRITKKVNLTSVK